MLGLATAIAVAMVILAAPARRDPIPPSAAAGSISRDAPRPGSNPAAPRPRTVSRPVEAAAGASSAQNAGDQDLRTFAYASADLAALQTSLGAVDEGARALSAAADSFAIGPVREAGDQLRSRAEGLRRAAQEATARLAPLRPSDPALARIRDQALETYRLAEAQAGAGIELAEFAISLDVSRAMSVARTIEDLESGGDGLAGTFGALASSLQAWEDANPSAAAAARSDSP
jgi:hypothetical protein